MILEKLITRLHRWQIKTFGPGKQVIRYTDHILDELIEVLEDPNSLEEWMDIVILALGGAARQGYTPCEIAEELDAKVTIIMARKYPDWRTVPHGEVINHIKEKKK